MLHASLALLPVDPSQAVTWGSGCSTSRRPSCRCSVRPWAASSRLTPMLWTELEKARPGDPSLLPSAGALACYDPGRPPMDARRQGGPGAGARSIPSSSATGSMPLRPCGARLDGAAREIFVRGGSEAEHRWPPTSWPIMRATTRTVSPACSWPPTRRRIGASSRSPSDRAEKVLPHLQGRAGEEGAFDWNDAPLDPSWTRPDPELTSRIEAAQGQLTDRFAFCQAMPLDEFLATAVSLRPSGYRPVRVQPFAEGAIVKVAAAWSRDGPGMGRSPRAFRPRRSDWSRTRPIARNRSFPPTSPGTWSQAAMASWPAATRCSGFRRLATTTPGSTSRPAKMRSPTIRSRWRRPS